jgi:hypothetical protein
MSNFSTNNLQSREEKKEEQLSQSVYLPGDQPDMIGSLCHCLYCHFEEQLYTTVCKKVN